MQLQTLDIENFRNLAPQTLKFSDGVNLLYGKNAAGKTNTLECIYLFASGRSFRTRKETEFIKRGESFAGADIRFLRAQTQNAEHMTLRWQKTGAQTFVKRMLYQGAETPRASEFLGIFRAVLFTPDHLSLIKGSPEERRRFLDMALSQLAPRYVRCMNEYLKVLSQKNSYLKKAVYGTPDNDYLEVLNEQLASSGAVLIRQRHAFAERLKALAGSFYSALSDSRETLDVRYLSAAGRDFAESSDTAALTARLRDIYRSDRVSELRLGRALHGPHKDDLAVYIADNASEKELDSAADVETDEAAAEAEQAFAKNESKAKISVSDFNARTFASQGQQRSAVLALKLAEGEIFKEVTGEYPVFLLDDLLGELDAERRSRLLKLIGGRQSIISCCDRAAFPENASARVLHITDGLFQTEA